MKMKQFTITPYQNFVDDEELNKNLAGATHVETYAIDEKRFGGYKTVVVYAFYPDEDSRPVQAGVMQKIADKEVFINKTIELFDDIKEQNKRCFYGKPKKLLVYLVDKIDDILTVSNFSA